jgi:hypothetical protein
LIGIDRRVVVEPDSPLRIGEQEKGEIVFLGERLVLLDRVEADAEDNRVLAFVILDSGPESFTLDRSPGCVGLGVEPENHVLAGEVGQIHLFSGVGLGRELGSLFTDL